MAKTIDLSTYRLAGGDHIITVKAHGNSINDSAASDSVTYTVRASTGYKVTTAPDFSYDSGGGSIDIYTDNYSGPPYEGGLILDENATYITVRLDASGGGMGYTMNGEYHSLGKPMQEDTLELTGDLVINDWSCWCLTGDTLVTMANGSQKRIDEIVLGEEILSFDWNTMTLIPNKVIFTDKDENKTHTEYDVWTFDNGTIIKTVHRHEFYNVEAGRMKYMDEWNIGEHAYCIDGTITALVSHKTIEEEVRHYKITGEKGTNYFANGLLNGDRNCPKEIGLGSELL